MPPNPTRTLVIDEDMNWKLARELRRRGMNATSVYELGLANQSVKDGQLVKRLAEIDIEPFVLVTWDNKMPRSHRGQLVHFNTTLAVIDQYADRGGRNEEEYCREVVHRHAHRIATQEAGSIFKYGRTRRSGVELGP